jgi:acetyl-CoA acetyltransferase
VTMRDVAVVSTAQTVHARRVDDRNEVEMLMPVLEKVKGNVGLSQQDIDFTVSGSTDYLAGQGFSFVTILDGVGPYPPIVESHVEMDGAWALYEAWVKIQTGAAETALVYSYGKSSPGDLRRVLSRQLDPYFYGPLWPDSVSLAALQAQAMIDAGKGSEAAFAEIAHAARLAAMDNPHATVSGDTPVDELLSQPHLVAPLHRHDCPPISDGAVAVILAADDRARELSDRPAWITGIDHRIDGHALGQRDLTTSPSSAIAADRAGVTDGPVDVAELHACFTPQQLILAESLGLGADTVINPSGGPLAANTVMAAGLVRIIEAADRIAAGDAERAVAHATSGPCLQQNLVCVLEGGD